MKYKSKSSIPGPHTQTYLSTRLIQVDSPKHGLDEHGSPLLSNSLQFGPVTPLRIKPAMNISI